MTHKPQAGSDRTANGDNTWSKTKSISIVQQENTKESDVNLHLGLGKQHFNHF